MVGEMGGELEEPGRSPVLDEEHVPLRSREGEEVERVLREGEADLRADPTRSQHRGRELAEDPRVPEPKDEVLLRVVRRPRDPGDDPPGGRGKPPRVGTRKAELPCEGLLEGGTHGGGRWRAVLFLCPGPRRRNSSRRDA